MEKRLTRLGILLGLLVFFIMIGRSYGRIPEPDNIIYGALPVGINSVVLAIDAEMVASYARGENPSAGDNFILRVPMDAIDPRQVGSARPGDSGLVYLDQEVTPIETVLIGEKGSVHELNLLAHFDTDVDGISDDVDNCPTIQNDDQDDADNDGFGDMCDNCPYVSNIDQDAAACDEGDTDGDGMPDNYEYRVGLSPDFYERDGDADSDGITNYDEYLAGTNPVPMCGDVSDDTYIELDDLIQVIQILSGVNISPNVNGDCTGNDQIGMAEALSILQELTGL